MRNEMPLPDEVALDRPSFSLQLSVPIFRKPLQTSLSKWDERLTSAIKQAEGEESECLKSSSSSGFASWLGGSLRSPPQNRFLLRDEQGFAPKLLVKPIHTHLASNCLTCALSCWTCSFSGSSSATRPLSAAFSSRSACSSSSCVMTLVLSVSIVLASL